MELETMTETRKVATDKWREYVAAEKIYRKPEFTDLKNIYNQIKGGRKVVDIFKVIKKGGQHDNLHPKLAIAKSSARFVYCTFSHTGSVCFSADRNRNMSNKKEDVYIQFCFPGYSAEKVNGNKHQPLMKLEAPVPLVPAKFLPKNLTDDYYTLWEVDVWKRVAPTDPYLLKRITNNIFVVLAGWDLTPLEKSVMEGRMI